MTVRPETTQVIGGMCTAWQDMTVFMERLEPDEIESRGELSGTLSSHR